MLLVIGVCDNPKISGTRWLGRLGSGQVPGDFEIPENFENPATVSRTTLQCCIVVYKICKYTVTRLCI